MGISGEEEIEMTSPSATPSMDEMRAGFVAWQDRVGDWREGGWEAFQAAVAWATARERERCAKVCEKRAELRFEAHGYTEPDTNASYYVGEYRDLGDSLDEEDADCAAAIRSAEIACVGRANCDQWFILSAKHGLLSPFDEVESYDHTLYNAGSRRLWSINLRNQLQPFKHDHLIVLAGERYCGWADGFNVTRPMQGLGIGRQLQWLTTNTQAMQESLL